MQIKNNIAAKLI